MIDIEEKEIELTIENASRRSFLQGMFSASAFVLCVGKSPLLAKTARNGAPDLVSRRNSCGKPGYLAWPESELASRDLNVGTGEAVGGSSNVEREIVAVALYCRQNVRRKGGGRRVAREPGGCRSDVLPIAGSSECLARFVRRQGDGACRTDDGRACAGY